jgi:hypothetical protein
MIKQFQFAAQRLASIEIWPVVGLAAVSVIWHRALP